jgi:hypothetical protein
MLGHAGNSATSALSNVAFTVWSLRLCGILARLTISPGIDPLEHLRGATA